LLITPSPEGLSVVHKDWGDMLACSSKELEEQIERGEIEDVTAASIALCVIKTRETPYKIALYSNRRSSFTSKRSATRRKDLNI